MLTEEQLIQAQEIRCVIVDSGDPLPAVAGRSTLTRFLYENMKPFEDPIPAIENGVDFALSREAGKGGFVALALGEGRLAGAVVVTRTGLKECVPENLLLFAAVRADLRGRGIGTRLIKQAISHCDGSVKLHVEYANPARRLYERLGFVNKYADMRYRK